jgi:hypothetical protein
MKHTDGRRQRQFRAALFAGLAAAGTLMLPEAAEAYTPLTTPNCSTITFSAPPRYVVHMTEFWAGGGGADDLAAIFQSIYDINRQFNQIDGTSAEIVLTGYNTGSISPFQIGDWFNDAVPTIHIGFTADSADTLGSYAAELTHPVDAYCHYSEAHIALLDTAHQDWNFGTPGDSGEDYYTAGDTDTAGAVWFRPSYLHELLHAFGLNHSDDTYAFMNYNDFPWANRPGADAIRPLPDDARGIRHLYPGNGSRNEVAVLNTWFDPGAVSYGSAIQHVNCAPSLGSADSANFFAVHCGEGGPDAGSTTVCPGDILRTRFSVANYSNHEVNLTARVYLSLDDRYDVFDAVSVNARPVTIRAAVSDHLPRTWTVPNPTTTNADYHVIARVTGTTTTGVYVEDWIPLTGTVHLQPANLC